MLRMGDGPVANLPAGLDAYAGYVNVSGIGETYKEVVMLFPNAKHLSITTDGSAALTADVENGAMSSWAGYTYGYCSVSRVNDLIQRFGRPKKLWTAHQDPSIGAHICSPACWPGLATEADGTQWIDHDGKWDESLLKDDFFTLQVVISPPPQDPTRRKGMYVACNKDSTDSPVSVRADTQWIIEGGVRWQVFDWQSVEAWYGRGPVAMSGNQIGRVPVAK